MKNVRNVGAGAGLNGAEALIRSLIASGIDTCFANPGTSEMHFVSALDRVEGVRCVLGLFEGVVTGAADGYGRMTGKPAVTLLHCGPGLAYGMANLHNARRGYTPIVNIVGDQATYHRDLDPPLASDSDGWARGVSCWVRTVGSADTIGQDAAVAVQAARSAPGGVASLIVPADTCWNPGGRVAEPLPVPKPSDVPAHKVEELARLLRREKNVLLLLGESALTEGALRDADRIAAATGAEILAQQFNARVPRGAGRVPIGRVPYSLSLAMDLLSKYRHVVIVGSRLPVAPFAYPDKPGKLLHPEADIFEFARAEQDLPKALAALADALGAPVRPVQSAPFSPDLATGKITQEAVTQSLAALLPEGAVVSDESVSYGRFFFPGVAGAAEHDWLQNTGAAIGIGLPMATGAAIGAPDRRVVALQADGSAMLTVQALWTQARERLPVTTVILSNRRYAILFGELANVGAHAGPTSTNMFSLNDPELNWVKMAEAMGVEAAAATTMEEFNDLFARANRSDNPFLIELMV